MVRSNRDIVGSAWAPVSRVDTRYMFFTTIPSPPAAAEVEGPYASEPRRAPDGYLKVKRW